MPDEIIVVENLRHVYRKGKSAPRPWMDWIFRCAWQVDVLRYYTYGAGDASRLQSEGAGFVLFLLLFFGLAHRSLNGSIE